MPKVYKFEFLQVHSIVTSSCVATVPTSLTCCKARLATSILGFLCLHSKFIAKVVTSNEIIAATNRKNIHYGVVRKETFVSSWVYVCSIMPFFQIKNFFLAIMLVNKVF